MPSFDHQLVLELLRGQAELVRRLLPARWRRALAAARGEPASADLSQLTPVEYRADHVVVFRDRQGAPALAVIVEVQRHIDRAKELSWPHYVTAARRSFGCAVVLMVLALDPRVAAWARGPLCTGHPGFVLRPLVISPRELPAAPSARDVRSLPELCVLSVLAHPTLCAARAALRSISALDAEPARLYFDVIMHALPPSARRALEVDMFRYEYKSEFARKYVAQGEAKGRAEGEAKGRAKGRAEGEAKGRAEGEAKGRAEGEAKGQLDAQRAAALALARAKLPSLDPSDVAVIDSLTDPERLSQLVLALGLARSARQARLALREPALRA